MSHIELKIAILSMLKESSLPSCKSNNTLICSIYNDTLKRIANKATAPNVSPLSINANAANIFHILLFKQAIQRDYYNKISHRRIHSKSYMC